VNPAQHDSYAADYDAQVRACDCHIADLQTEPYIRYLAGDFEIFSHSTTIAVSLKQSALTWLKLQKCLVGEEIFLIWGA